MIGNNELKPEEHFVFKVLTHCAEGPRLLTPWADPNTHEYAFDFVFKSEADAMDYLKDMDAEDEAHTDGWVLCKETTTPIRQLNSVGGNQS